MRHVIPLLALAIGVLACQDSVITVPDEGPQLAEASAGPVRSVIGGGSIVREDIEGAPRETYGFRAQINGAGNVTGDAEVHFPSNDVKMHIAVRCLAIERNLAWLSGEVTRSDDPATPIGMVFVWLVQDNGQRQDGPPDRISNFIYRAEGNYPPDVCQDKQPLTTYPWDNGNVEILTPGGPSVSDLVGTWDATTLLYYRLPDLGDTLDALAGADEARWTVAPNGHYSLVWWAPGVIYENIAGTVDVVNGQLIQTVYGDPAVIVLDAWRVTGDAISGGADLEFGHDWTGDGNEDPSRIVMEWRKKRTGLMVDDLAGIWAATAWRYTSTVDPTMTVDLVSAGVAISFRVGLDSRYTVAFTPGGTSMGELIVEGDQLLVRNGESTALTFALEGDQWSFSGSNEYDFDGDGTGEPATLEVTLVRS